MTRWFEGRTTTTATAYRDGARLDVEKSWSATIVVTFNGTPYPDVAINGSWFYVWDLETGAIYRGNSAWAAPQGPRGARRGPVAFGPRWALL